MTSAHVNPPCMMMVGVLLLLFMVLLSSRYDGD